jgi:hypothetical protein
MPFDWNNFLTLAEQLSQVPEDASKRSAMSRAYYAAFHDAMTRAEANCGPQDRSKSHQWCWNRYIYSRDDDCYQLGIDGSRLRAMRNLADYEPDIQRIDDLVTRALSNAKSIKRRIAALDAQLPRP